MGLSYRNIIDENKLKDALSSGDFSGVLKTKENLARKNAVRYIKGYAEETAIEALAKSLGLDSALFKQLFGIETKITDNYDPYHLNDSKKEEFWYDNNDQQVGRDVQSKYDEDTNTFKRGLYSFKEYDPDPEGKGYGSDFWYEDPLIPSFELYFDHLSPLFNDENVSNCLNYFLNQYATIDPVGYANRRQMWNEFKNVFFRIFEKILTNDKESQNVSRNFKNKSYYITKISGLNNINKKIINHGTHGITRDGDKITITINEDVSMIAWYLSELYKNIIYSYKEQRYMFPENLLRFNMLIKINDMRNFQIPKNKNGNVEYEISPKSQIIYTLHDCYFDFFESRNFNEEMEIGGYGAAPLNTPSTLSFDIYYKSVTRSSNYPLIAQSTALSNTNQDPLLKEYYNTLDRIKMTPTDNEPKKYLDQLITKAKQTAVNTGLDYLDNLETKLREIRGSAVNNLLKQFRNATNINKIEPDNIYDPGFNNRASFRNFAKREAAGLVNLLEDSAREAFNF